MYKHQSPNQYAHTILMISKSIRNISYLDRERDKETERDRVQDLAGDREYDREGDREGDLDALLKSLSALSAL